MNKEKLAKELKDRLSRIEGQARGVQRMIDEQAECEKVLIQLAAMKAAVDQVGMKVLGCYMADAVKAQMEGGAEADDAIDNAIRLLGKL
ncbi:MAG: Copper-sensing transcriptional repressor RicR [Firmicutes bacterium]|nr:Copper-sensing transcriptional repressor RicR [candidate division NPL-UPA2 bacterium]MBT9154009.1 Copper-sensing transcriptional repressor RicR [candidate division NPL-UPA2 bacterium]